MPLLFRQQVRRPAADVAGQAVGVGFRAGTGGIDGDFLAQGRAGIDAADPGHVQEALLDLGHDKPDLVHVGREHDPRGDRCAPSPAGNACGPSRNQIAERVGAYFGHRVAGQGPDELGDLRSRPQRGRRPR